MILIISGSPRRVSNNRGLATYIYKLLENSNSEVELFDFFESPLPIFTGESFQYDNENVLKFSDLVSKANKIVICTPEYHNGMSGALKNGLDYLNKTHFKGKLVTLMCAAGSGKGGINALNNLRVVLRSLHAIILPEQYIVDSEHFDEKQNIINDECKLNIKDIIDDLNIKIVTVAHKHKQGKNCCSCINHLQQV